MSIKRYFIFRAYHFFKTGQPLPVDVYFGIVNNLHISPDELYCRFEAGITPKDILDV